MTDGADRAMRRDLSAMLDEYRPSDPREADFQKRMLALAAGPGPFDRGSYAPGHFTASAFVLSPEEDALLLIFHRKLSRWLQPGGHVEPSDGSVLGAARREVAEEVGLHDLRLAAPARILFDIDIHPIPARPDEPAHEHFDLRFLFVAPSREFAASNEVAGARWVPLDGLDAVTGDESVRRAVRKVRPRGTAA